MPKVSKILILTLAILGLFWFGQNGFQGVAQETKPQEAKPIEVLEAVEKKLPKIIDKNKNKIFDNLEKLLEKQPDERIFNTIVLFEEDLSDALLEKAKMKIGHFFVKYQYPNISGIAVTLTKGQIIALSKIPGVKQIENDAKAEIFLDKASYWFGIEKARTDFGLDGNLDEPASYSKDDIVVAIIDTGIDYNHLDLDGGKVIGQKCFCCSAFNPSGKCVKPCCPNGETEDDNALDDAGHGTHVSSIVAGEGEGNSNYKGVAPGAALVGIKVLDSEGGGYMSYVNAGIQWVIDNKNTFGIEVINISLGAAGSYDGTDSTSQLVNEAVDVGIVVVVSAGNEGPEKYTIGSPAAADEAITVGAMADVEPGAPGSFNCGSAPGCGFYQICFSSRGPTADGRIKPDISAPGVFITAAEMGTTNGYVEKSGTSMSSPFMAGLAGLILQASPTLTPAQVKTKITDTALDWGLAGDDIDYGAGRLDGYEAIKSAGGYSGTNIAIPKHQHLSGSLAGTGDTDWYDINVTDNSYPIAVTLIMPDWTFSTNPDFDIYLYEADGTTELARSWGINRQETIGYHPSGSGVYKLKVQSYSGSGNYFFDQSAGTAIVSISITSDGLVEFGTVALGAVKANDPDDIQTISVDTGPADLKVRSTVFFNGINNWTLGGSGNNQVTWEYSKNGTNWSEFLTDDVLYLLNSNVPHEGTQDLHLRITMPTETAFSNQYSSTVTIVATAP